MFDKTSYRFPGCPMFSGCRTGSKECWRNGHIHFVHMLNCRYGSQVDVWRTVFERWVRRKEIAWPDEVECFSELYRLKHREICSSTTYSEMSYYGRLGAYHDRRFRFGTVSPLFHPEGALAGSPVSPKPEDRNKVFLNRSLLMINQILMEKKRDQRA
jgi:hypothetical protein